MLPFLAISIYIAPMNDADDPLRGLTAAERRIMDRLLRTSPKQQKNSPKPMTAKGDAQRRRREKERKHSSESSRG